MRIAITQRVEWIEGYGERRDCLDQQWGALLESWGIDVVPVPNRLAAPQEWLTRQQVAGIILTGGNDLAHLPDACRPAPERDATETALLSSASLQRLPVLGVCRGMQMLNHFLGGRQVLVRNHVAVRHAVQALNDGSPFSSYLEVNSFHSWGMSISDLAPDVSAQVCAVDGTVEAFTHDYLPWVGLMWHPERENPVNPLDAQLIRKLFESETI